MNRILALSYIFFVLLGVICSCQKEYSYESAAGSLRDSTGDCNPIEISGYYRKGASLASDSFFVNIEVNITKTGAYTISTDLVNGFSFAAAGNFQNKGIQNVRLKAQGMPLSDTLSVFNCSFDNSICTFSIRVKTDSIVAPVIVAPRDTMELNTWYFTDGTDGTFHRGIIDELSTWLKISGDKNYLNIMGWPGTHTASNMDTLFLIELYLPRLQIDTGTYPITTGIQGSNNFGYANNKYLVSVQTQSFFYFYRSTEYNNTDFIFRIISYDPVQRLVLGSFEGSSQRRKEYSDYVGQVHQIQGKFYFKLQ